VSDSPSLVLSSLSKSSPVLVVKLNSCLTGVQCLAFGKQLRVTEEVSSLRLGAGGSLVGVFLYRPHRGVRSGEPEPGADGEREFRLSEQQVPLNLLMRLCV
jgi:hypothetical protein